jgi:hypothetical protein
MRRFEPTPDQRRTVKTMAGFGIPQEDIAKFLGIDDKTLRKHFREELDRGVTEANAKVAQSLFQMATQGKNVAAAIFWMKARGGWREKHEVEVTAATSPRFVVHAPEPMTVEEWTEKYVPKDLA